MLRFAGVFSGSLVSRRYRRTRPTCTCQARIQSVEPGKAIGDRTHAPLASRRGRIGSWPGSLNG